MRKTILLAFWAMALPTCSQQFVIQVDKPRQQILHFGASDAWSMQRLGMWENEAEQEKVADWLFSLDFTDDGHPKGIGLSLWRFNLGAGSAEQGNDAQINPSTRTECFLCADGSYDFSRQAGQRKFLKMAQQRGVPHFLAFLNSPPVYYTQNGLASNTGRGGTLNLREECYTDFARFMARSLKGLEAHDGIHFDYICPVNEPDGHWNWIGPKQEGTPATNRETAKLARVMSGVFQEEEVSTQILLNESSDLRCLLGIYQTTWERGNTIRTFFSPDSTNTSLAGLPGVPRLLLAHSYWTNTPVDYMRRIREQLRDTLRHYGVDFWQSEVCIMSNDTEIGGGNGYDFSMKTALYVARIIHHDLKFAEAQSWSWWRACGGNYKDGLVRMYERQQRASDSKLLWAMGQYSRFVRPGAVRYDVEGPEQPYGLMTTAYRNGDGSWAVVVINYAEASAQVSVGMSDGESRQWQLYRTTDTDGENLAPVGICTGQTTLPARSITTFLSRK